MIEDVKTKLEDETMDVEGPGDENDPNNPFNRRGEKLGKRGKCKVVSRNNGKVVEYWNSVRSYLTTSNNVNIPFIFRPLKTLSSSKFWAKGLSVKSYCAEKRLQTIYML